MVTLKDRKFPTYGVKNFALDVKDVDSESRKVKVALSRFGVMDSDRDIILRGAFKKSINERGPSSSSNRKIAFLRYHDWEHQIGKFLELSETDTELVGVAELGRSTKANDAFLDYQDGIIREHSIGFQYVSDKMKFIEHPENPYWEISEVMLWEGSAVTFGANSLTPTHSVSKGNVTEIIEKVNKQMNALTAALRSGQGTDERLYQIEMGLKVCQEQYNSLLSLKPDESTSKREAEEARSKQDEANNFKKNLLINLNF